MFTRKLIVTHSLSLCLILMGILLCAGVAEAQTQFSSEGQIFMVIDDTRQFGQLTIDPSNNAIKFVEINPDIGMDLFALAFRRTDGLVYGIESSSLSLHVIDADGVHVKISDLDLNPAYTYSAGDIDASGRWFTAIGFDGAVDRELVRIDLNGGSFEVTAKPMAGTTRILDVAHDPYSGDLYGIDGDQRQLVRINVNNGSVTAFSQLFDGNDVQGVYFDPFGEFYGLGTGNDGVAGSIFNFDQTSFAETRIATGPVYLAQDVAVAQYTVAMRLEVSPREVFPCNDISYTYSIGNSTGQELPDIDLSHSLPGEIIFGNLVQNNFGGQVNLSPGNLSLSNITVKRGISTARVQASVGDIDGGEYGSQAYLQGLPAQYGSSRPSDNPVTVRQEDPTIVEVNRIEEDSLFLSYFICFGDTAVLDGGAYGTDLEWSDGSGQQVVYAVSSGQFVLSARSGCQTTIITFEVTAASCPFTIELLHETIPRETYPCKDVVYRFIIENDAGAEYYGIDFIDTLPEQLVVLQVLGDALGGQVVAVPESNIIYIRDMHLPLGRDTLEVLVEVGDIAPGSYPNRAIIRNFPVVLGPVRWSDDPATQENDSTVLTVLGVERDTLVVEEIVCEGNSLVLDGRPYGLEFQWDNGFSSATREVDEPGIYELVAFDGCNPSYIFFDVVPGDLIDVFFTDERLLISLGDSIDLMPQLYNTGDTAIVQWSDPWGKSILCADCLITRAGPLNSTQYKIYVMNETCSDSAEIQIDVDNSRQFFAPNVFSPNNDGINDYFYLQSRQFAIIESFTIADRWNNVVFHTTAHEMNNQSSGWDGTRGGQPLAPGAYVWQAKMTFLDMKTEYYGGQVLLVR